ncbi:glycosyltransferase family 4 protein [uncultured Bacteroides sp.]|uniref:glycosyltransferase family 4 protein n=1 Tax=uncultured Bacteroides sp. TaxID=162156 RepID=UPI0026767197|nr:glycosyltransferase family 4 protein [uncultured Bacteroides sp.]
MKILQVGKFYPIRGGIEKVMFDIMTGLSQKHIPCDMLCASADNRQPGDIPLNEYAKLICIPVWKKVAATMLAPSMISRLRKIRKEYDLIHIHHPDPMACVALFLSGYEGHVILHWHSDILKQKILLRFYRPLQNWLIRRAEIIVGTTPVYVSESPFLQKVQDKIRVVPIGVDDVKPDAGQVARIREKYAGKKIIFSLGRLVEYKGYEYLIRAACRLGDDCIVLIGGEGPLRTYLQTLVEELGVAEKVSLLGYVADDELPSYFGACDIFCLSSVWKTEAFAIVQVEAMSCGKPIVATEIPESGVSWVNADGVSGINVPVKDADALAQAVTDILSDRHLYGKLSEGARRRYEAMFTKERMTECCLELYRELSEKRKVGRGEESREKHLEEKAVGGEKK